MEYNKIGKRIDVKVANQDIEIRNTCTAIL
jgi:hypothetical protein